MPGEGSTPAPLHAKIDETKNPKWLDLADLTPSRDVSRCIYELSGDKLRICIGGDTKDPRPAEFGTEEGLPYLVYEFRREKLPPPAGDKALLGSWQGDAIAGAAGGQRIDVPPARVEILDGYVFFTTSKSGRPVTWIGGKYTVDTTKNPKWVDVELIGPLFAEKASKLYGSYEIVDGRLKMALGVKRLTRPLEFTQATDAILLDVKATKEPIPPGEKIVREPPSVPVPGPSSTTLPPVPVPGPSSTTLPPAPTRSPKSLPQADPPYNRVPPPARPGPTRANADSGGVRGTPGY